MVKKIRRIYVANRGEIAVRIIYACRSLGIETVLGFSEADRDTLGVTMADRAICIGPPIASESYLSLNTVVAAARATNCDALHPGYGFLSERAVFRHACEKAGLIFIGPRTETLKIMGDKLHAISIARKAGVSILPSSGPLKNIEEARSAASEIGFPCLLKASAGGGGRGMRILYHLQDLEASFSYICEEAKASFGNETVYIEKYIERARHIEIQILGDNFGNIVHLFERDCTIQRRHQKLIEESPSTVISDQVRTNMIKAALSLARLTDYTSAGTVEFIFDLSDKRFYFLEMNTRIQVEHPVTEILTDTDIVREQIQIAQGYPLSFLQKEVKLVGHAIECRINAENPFENFCPSPGKLEQWTIPQGKNIRVDSHCYEGYIVPIHYDSMLAKIIVRGADRNQTIKLMKQVLRQTKIRGIATTIKLHLKILEDNDFQQSNITTNWLENVFLQSRLD